MLASEGELRSMQLINELLTHSVSYVVSLNGGLKGDVMVCKITRVARALVHWFQFSMFRFMGHACWRAYTLNILQLCCIVWTLRACIDTDLFLFAVALRPNAGHDLLILEVSRSHTTTHHSRLDSSGRVISSSQRPLPDNTQHSQQTNIHASGGIRTHDLSKRAAADLRLRPRGYWDQQILRL